MTSAERADAEQPSRLKVWGSYLARRLAMLVVVLVGVSLLTFGLTRMAGSPLYAAVGQQVTPEMVEARAELLGLNEPLWRQYVDYMVGLTQGDLGESRRTFTPVTQEISERLPATAELVAAAVLLNLLWAVPLGYRAARHPNGWARRVGDWVSQLGVAVPGFWLGLLLIYLFYFLIPIFPAPLGRLGNTPPPPFVTGFITIDSLIAGDLAALQAGLWHLALPAITLSFTSAPPIYRVTRTAVDAVLASQYVEAARSYGLREKVITRRIVLKNAVLPVLNLTAMTFGYLIGGAVLVEVVFSWPGIGSYAVRAMDFADYDAVLGVVLVSALIYMLLYFLVDVIDFAVDPRLRE